MNCDTKQTLVKIGVEFKACPHALEGSPFLMRYCRGCTKYGTEACQDTRRDVYVQGAWPWDCMFCDRSQDELCGSDPRTYDDCPLIDADGEEEGCRGCPKLSSNGEGTFCPYAVRHITVHGGDFGPNGPCERYEFNKFFPDSHGVLDPRSVLDEDYMFSFHSSAVRRLAHEHGWLTVGDLLRNIRRPMLDAVTGDKGAATRAWRALHSWADVAGYYVSEDGDRFVCRTPDEQTRHVHRLRVYATACRAQHERDEQKKPAKQAKRGK